MDVKRIALAYSGGLDTSVAIQWLKETYGAEVVAVAIDVGEEREYDQIRQKALDTGAAAAYVVEARDRFARDFILPALKAGAVYNDKYLLATALARPLIAEELVRVAAAEGCDAVAHGATGKGNDQVRFEVTFMALDPSLKCIAPAREWGMTREEEIAYAKRHGIPIPVTVDDPYSLDVNLWGRSCECGVLEDPNNAPPEAAYGWTCSPEQAPDTPEYVEIGFLRGVPTTLNGEEVDLATLVGRLNEIGGRHGVGRVDLVEDRLVGIKSREIYECPAGTILHLGHRDLEHLCLDRDTLEFKRGVALRYAQLVYNGLWHSPLKRHLDAYVESTQRTVTGTVRLKLFKGQAVVDGRTAPKPLYSYELATYDEADAFDHTAAVGFIKVWGMPTMIAAAVEREG